jgi:Trk-type K+ transport system membrane component
MANYGHLPAAAKWVLAAVMLSGRLEISGPLLSFCLRSLR